MEQLTACEKDGRGYVSWVVGEWEVYAGQAARDSSEWQVLVLPYGEPADGRRLKRIYHGLVSTRANALAVAASIAAALAHVQAEGAALLTAPGGREGDTHE